MKKLIITTFGILLLTSCSEDETPTPTVISKIFFDGYNSNVGTTGIKWSEIYSINSDGSGQQQLTNYSNNGTNAINSEEVTLNGDKTKIIFTSNKDILGTDFFSMNLDGTNLTNISNNSSGNYYYKSTVYQSGTKLIFYKESYVSPDKYGEIYTSNIDFANKIKLTTYPIDGSCYDASINPSNTNIVYSYKQTGLNNQIYSMSINGANKTLLTTNNTLYKTHPTYSPDGTKIIFEGAVASTTNKHSEIFIMNSNGTNIIQLTNYSLNGVNGSVTKDAIFSNDGTQIYYVSDESGISQIYRMNIDGSAKTKLTTSTEDKYNPVIK